MNRYDDRAESFLRETIRDVINDVIAERKKRKKRRKPGGGLTDLGAKRRVQKLAFTGEVGGALEATSGNVYDTARRLEVSPRTVYSWLEDEPSLQRAKDRAEGEDEDEDENDR